MQNTTKPLYKIDTTEFPFETKGIIGIITEQGFLCWALDLYAGSNNDSEGNSIAPKFSFTELQESTDFVYIPLLLNERRHLPMMRK